MLTLITGGSAGGKSEYAENIIPSDGPRVYLATMEPFGKEAERRIERHRKLREGKGFDTVECSVNIGRCFEVCRGKHVLLEDLPNLIANETFSSHGNGIAGILPLLWELEKISASLTCVTGILTEDGRRYDADTMKYLRNLTEIERALAERAHRVIEVVCGIGSELDTGKSPGTNAVFKEGRGNLLFVTGPMYSGKKDFVKRVMNFSDEEFERCAVWNAQELVNRSGMDHGQLESLADELARKEIVIADEMGCGVVPVEREERERREKAGRLACMLAERADTVVRVVCGCPQILKRRAYSSENIE